MNKILGITKDIEKSFKRLSSLTVVAVAGSLSFAEKQREKIYVLDQGKSLLLALQTDAILSKDVEIRDHVTRFHELMFTLSPQKQTIQENLDRAFNLADRSAWEYSQDLAEKGYYARLVSANISQQMIVDSVSVVGEPQEVKIRVDCEQVWYFDSLPLHHSQQKVEAESTEEYTVYRYYVAPNYEFRHELLGRGPEVEVLAPESFRREVAEDVAAMAKAYGV